MEAIQEILRESVSGGFWKFMGYYLIIFLVLSIPLRMLGATYRYFTIRKLGYPPKHCDVNGKKRKKKSDNTSEIDIKLF